MTTIPNEVRERVRQRAGDRCEYCLSQQEYVMGRLQIDHIQPVAKGGVDSEDNLCLACELCNQYKWTQTEAHDPETGKMLSLFSPRQQKWAEHFIWSEDGTEIIGQTACGRVTVEALRLNNALAVLVRRNWGEQVGIRQQ
jgi:hypothetical protein